MKNRARTIMFVSSALFALSPPLGCATPNSALVPIELNRQQQNTGNIQIDVALNLTQEFRNFSFNIFEDYPSSGGGWKREGLYALGTGLSEDAEIVAREAFAYVDASEYSESPSEPCATAVLTPRILSVDRTAPAFAGQAQKTEIQIHWSLSCGTTLVWEETITGVGSGKAGYGLISSQNRAAYEQVQKAMDDVFQRSFEAITGSPELELFAVMRPLFYATAEAHPAIAERILGESSGDEDRNTLFILSFASERGSVALARAILATDVDVNEMNREIYPGLTPLHLASQHHHREILRLLLDNGANINIKDNGGRTALHRAALRGDEGMVGYLSASGAGVDPHNATAIDSYATAMSFRAVGIHKGMDEREGALESYKAAAAYFEKASVQFEEMRSGLSADKRNANITYFVKMMTFAVAALALRDDAVLLLPAYGNQLNSEKMPEAKRLEALIEIASAQSKKSHQESVECDRVEACLRESHAEEDFVECRDEKGNERTSASSWILRDRRPRRLTQVSRVVAQPRMACLSAYEAA